MSDVEEYPVPALTFGTEQEFSYIITRELYYAFIGKEEPKTNKTPSSPVKVMGHQAQSAGEEDLPGMEYIQTTPTKEGSQRSLSSISTRTDSSELVNALIQYILDTLNHKLADSPQPGSLLKVVESEPHVGANSQWCLTYESALSPTREQYAHLNELPHDAVREKFYVGAGELVSRIIDLNTDWLPMYKQIHSDLKFNGEKGLWYNGTGGLHVHFGIKDEELDFETVRNVVVLYGLYEKEIGTWLHVRRRDLKDPFPESTYCRSLRGMERFPALKYTPQDFSERIYQTNNLLELRIEAGDGTIVWNDTETHRAYHKYAVGSSHKYVTVNISLARESDNKKTTLEFRQHEATDDPLDIKWWVLFCAQLLYYSRQLAQLGRRLLDEDHDVPNGGTSFVGELTKTPLLDLIAFSDEGKEYFKKRKQRMNDDGANAQRALEAKLVQARVKRRQNGEELGKDMDEQIVRESWYAQEAAQLLANHNINLTRVQNEDYSQQINHFHWLMSEEDQKAEFWGPTTG